MRIIAGAAGGRIINMPKGIKTRPTQDRVREAIFNIIREAIPGARVLDLYAGSGAFGIEALSRGASFAAFVDNSQECIRVIKSNLSVMGETDGISRVIKMDTGLAISMLERDKEAFDIVFLDPPYHKEPFDKLMTIRRTMSPAESLAKNCLIKLGPCAILSKRSFVVAEHFKKDVIPPNISNIARFRESSYGDTIISFYKRVE